MYNIIKYSISIVSFIGIILSLIFLINTEYNAFSIVLIVSLEYIFLSLLNFIFINKRIYLKDNIISFLTILIGSILTVLLMYVVRTPRFSIFYIVGIIWIITLEVIDVTTYKKNNPNKG